MTSVSEPAKPAATMTRNALGDLLTKTTAAGHATSFDYDVNGGLIKLTDPAMKVWQIQRDAVERQPT